MFRQWGLVNAITPSSPTYSPSSLEIYETELKSVSFPIGFNNLCLGGVITSIKDVTHAVLENATIYSIPTKNGMECILSCLSASKNMQAFYFVLGK